VRHKNSGKDRNKIEISVEIPVPARFRARDRKEFLRNFELSLSLRAHLPQKRKRGILDVKEIGEGLYLASCWVNQISFLLKNAEDLNASKQDPLVILTLNINWISFWHKDWRAVRCFWPKWKSKEIHWGRTSVESHLVGVNQWYDNRGSTRMVQAKLMPVWVGLPCSHFRAVFRDFWFRSRRNHFFRYRFLPDFFN
jgi:hypothetical protein